MIHIRDKTFIYVQSGTSEGSRLYSDTERNLEVIMTHTDQSTCPCPDSGPILAVTEV